MIYKLLCKYQGGRSLKLPVISTCTMFFDNSESGNDFDCKNKNAEFNIFTILKQINACKVQSPLGAVKYYNHSCRRDPA